MDGKGIELEFLSGPRDGEVVVIGSNRAEVGRDQGVHLQLSFDRSVSRRHAKIIREGDSFLVEDLGSSFGTIVDGKRIRGTSSINQDSIVAFGHTEVKVRVPSPVSTNQQAQAEQSSEG